MSQRSKGQKKNDDALDRETLAQGDLEVEAGRRAALGGVADRQSVRRRNEDEHFACLLYRTALGRQS